MRVMSARRKTGSTWYPEVMFVTFRGKPYLLRRAVDEHGTEPDILLKKRHEKAIAQCF